MVTEIRSHKKRKENIWVMIDRKLYQINYRFYVALAAPASPARLIYHVLLRFTLSVSRRWFPISHSHDTMWELKIAFVLALSIIRLTSNIPTSVGWIVELTLLTSLSTLLLLLNSSPEFKSLIMGYHPFSVHASCLPKALKSLDCSNRGLQLTWLNCCKPSNYYFWVGHHSPNISNSYPRMYILEH